MTTVAPSPVQAFALTSARSQLHRRIAMMFTVFWHMLRRDVLVAGRDIVSFIAQMVLQPLFILFVFGKVLLNVGATQHTFPGIFYPGVVALTVVMTALQGTAISLTLDLSLSREIEDRLLAPVATSLIALEKVIFSTLRGMLAGALTFPMAYVVLGSGYQVRTDMLAAIVGIMLLAAFAGASIGLLLGTLFQAEQMNVLFSLVFNILMFAGCVFYPWSALQGLKPFQIVTLFNPLTYASEGLRFAMVPSVNGQMYATLPIGWAVLGLSAASLICCVMGIHFFHKRVVS